MKLLVAILSLVLTPLLAHAQATRPAWLDTGQFRWTSTPPLLAPHDRDGEHYYSVKDPSVVHHDGKWHVFCTVRGQKRSHNVEYFAFTDWDKAGEGERHLLPISDGYYCAPQVFYFRPHKKWYLVYQINGPEGVKSLQPAFSTNDDVGDWRNWTKPEAFYDTLPDNAKNWIDFWVICDDRHAYLFFTSDDGRLWRARTSLADFPKGWSKPEIIMTGDIFEASATYKLKGTNRYLKIIECVAPNGRRYFKAFTADHLDGEWTPLAGTLGKNFAARENVTFTGERWADSISHGELVRSSNDERLEIDPAHLAFVYQGLTEAQQRGKPYGELPWRIGLLSP
jgi:hypothetical protein